jgi:hypothetical protein
LRAGKIDEKRGESMEELPRDLIASQVQAYQALAELAENMPAIPEACRRCPHGGDLHRQRFERFRLLASGLMQGLSGLIQHSIKALGGKVALTDDLEAKSSPQSSWQITTQD